MHQKHTSPRKERIVELDYTEKILNTTGNNQDEIDDSQNWRTYVQGIELIRVYYLKLCKEPNSVAKDKCLNRQRILINIFPRKIQR
jgi:hypothetical protein